MSNIDILIIVDTASWSSVGRQQGGEKKKGCRQAAVGTQLPHGGLFNCHQIVL